jgi:carboxyl-terminal processing protease
VSVSLVILACSGDGAGEPASTPEADVAPGRDGLIATATVLPAVSVPDDVPEGLEAVWEAYAQLTREYVDREELEVEAMAEGAIRGMIDAIDDRYTAYVSPENYTRQMESFRGDFEGIGAVIQNTPDGKRIVIVSPLDDTPAERAGLKPGDIIMAVDGDDTEGWSVIDAVTRIRGPKGTPVELLLQHIGEPEPVAVTIIRGTIETPSVSVSMLPDDPYAIVRISSFTDRTPDELEEALAEVREANAKGIILDMRANPGGMLAATVDVASEFLDGGLVTYEIDGRGARKDWNARSGGSALDMPLVVLVDEFSASGSELLAAAPPSSARPPSARAP